MFSFFDKSRDHAERTLVASHAETFERATMSWGSIFAGTLTALVAQLVLNLLGVGIGLSAVSPKGGGAGAEALSIGAGLWLLVSSIVAFALGGYLAGRLSRLPIRSLAGYHGLVTWALTTVIAIFVVTGAIGGVVGGSFSAISGIVGGAGSALGGAGSALQSAVQTASPQLAQLKDPAAKILSQLKAKADQPDKIAARDDAIAAVKAALSSDPDQRQAATDKAAQALSKLTGTSVDDARAQITSYEDRYDELTTQAKDEAASVASTAATVASRGALFASFALIVGALAALFAGRLAAVRAQTRLAQS